MFYQAEHCNENQINVENTELCLFLQNYGEGHNMPIWLHLTLIIITPFIGLFGVLQLISSTGPFIENSWTNLVFCLGILISGYMIPRLIFKFLLPAHCPACKSRSFFHGGQPVTYHCVSCAYIHRTGINEGGKGGGSDYDDNDYDDNDYDDSDYDDSDYDGSDDGGSDDGGSDDN
ncbi:MAG: hypothetical protein D3903_20455 [Candidatus Electrothrix sp. GM3_4]|nr:hypothetical protein [Candidatus Electrothrix sp. GM3_4]